MGFKAWVRSSTDQLHNIAVQGPKSRDLLKEIIWTAPAQPRIGELEWFRFAVGRIGHFEGVPLVISRTGYTGELGYEIFCHPKDALAVFDAVWEAGQKHGISPLGLEALDMLRIEAGLIFANYEFTDQTDPFEAGIGFTVPLKTKGDDFIGKAALVERKDHPRHKLVGLDIDANDAVGHGDCVHIGRAQIGVVTSGTPLADSQEEHRSGPRRCHTCGARHRRRDRQARRPSKAPAGPHRAFPAFRSGEDAGEIVSLL